MTDGDDDEDEDELKGPYLRYVRSMSAQIEAAAAMCITINLNREDFISICTQAFDWLQRWHDGDEKELDEEIDEFLNDPKRNKQLNVKGGKPKVERRR